MTIGERVVRIAPISSRLLVQIGIEQIEQRSANPAS